MGHTFSVDAEPPDRTDPGRCADRFSPNASPLFDAAREVIATSPESFPIRQTVEVVVTSAAPLRQRVGYGPAEPMIEILVDAGVLWDERRHRVRGHPGTRISLRNSRSAGSLHGQRKATTPDRWDRGWRRVRDKAQTA